jgi:hypothetical protein
MRHVRLNEAANIAAALACETLAARPKIFVAIQLEEHQASDGS